MIGGGGGWCKKVKPQLQPFLQVISNYLIPTNDKIGVNNIIFNQWDLHIWRKYILQGG